jgi:hypothetical protein
VNDITLFTVKDKALKLFANVHNVEHKATENGYLIKKEFTYAITSKKDFKIPSVSLKAYSLKNHNYYTLFAPGYDIHVKPTDSSTLIDKEDIPIYEKIDFEFYKNIFIGIILFLAGFMSAKLSESIHFSKKESPFRDITDAQTPQALLLVLLHHYRNKEIKEYLQIIEEIQRKEGKMSLQKLKKKILQEFM